MINVSYCPQLSLNLQGPFPCSRNIYPPVSNNPTKSEILSSTNQQQGMPMRQPLTGMPMTGQPMMPPTMMSMGMQPQQSMPIMMQPTMMQPQPVSHDQNGGQNVKLDPFGAF